MSRVARPLMYLGVIGLVLVLAEVHALYIGHYPLTGSSRFAWTLAYAGILCVMAYGFGLPDVPRSRRAAVGASVGASFAGAGVTSVLQLFVGDALLPRFVVFGAAILLPDWYRICVGLTTGSRHRAEERDRVLVVGDPDEVAALELELHGSPERGALVVGSLSVEEAGGDGHHSPIVAIASECAPTVVVLDRRAQDSPSIVSAVASLHERGVRVRTLVLFYDEWLGKLPSSELERMSLFFDISEVHRAGYGRAKRIFDLALAVPGMLALLVVLPMVWVTNLVVNPGPLFYRQERVGKGGVPFTIIKLRTMVVDGSEGRPSSWTTEADPRVTRFGRLLRSSHLDELPQVVNVVRGELSLVGPRPEQPHYVDELSDKLAFYRLRHLVRPGLTGWAQVKYGYAGSESAALEKLQYEFWYLRHQSVSTDVKIIGRTIRSVLGSEGKGR